MLTLPAAGSSDENSQDLETYQRRTALLEVVSETSPRIKNARWGRLGILDKSKTWRIRNRDGPAVLGAIHSAKFGGNMGLYKDTLYCFSLPRVQ